MTYLASALLPFRRLTRELECDDSNRQNQRLENNPREKTCNTHHLLFPEIKMQAQRWSERREGRGERKKRRWKNRSEDGKGGLRDEGRKKERGRQGEREGREGGRWDGDEGRKEERERERKGGGKKKQKDEEMKEKLE